MSDVVFIILLLSPMVVLEALDLREWLRARRWEFVPSFDRWRTWIRFIEPQPEHQVPLAKDREQKGVWSDFRFEENQSCRFRLRTASSRFCTVGQITWDGREIHVEGRMSRLRLASPVISALWMMLAFVAAYARMNPETTMSMLLVATGLVITFVVISFSLTYVIYRVSERTCFMKAYREIKSRLWTNE